MDYLREFLLMGRIIGGVNPFHNKTAHYGAEDISNLFVVKAEFLSRGWYRHQFILEHH